MNYQNPNFQPLGRRAILVSWPSVIDENMLEFILFAKKYIQNKKDEPIVEIIHTYSSLLIEYDGTIRNIYTKVLVLKKLISTLVPPKITSCELFHLPVCYDQKFGLDLKLLSTENKLDFSEIPTLHAGPIYTIYFMGFLPGFLYLGGLDKKLFCERKKHPRKRIKKGAVGIGGNQTGIYPKSSPGGWQIIGNCPIGFFDVDQNPPSVFRAGDKIKFYPVSMKEHNEILEQVKNGVFQPKKEMYEP